MGKSLTKSDLSWVLIKLTGIYFVYQGLASLFGAVAGWWMMKETMGEFSSDLDSGIWNPFKILALSSLPALLVGIYFLRSGRLIHRLLMFIPLDCRAAERDGAIPGINLEGDELEEFKQWLEGSPEISKRDRADQLALFRDAQRAGKTKIG